MLIKKMLSYGVVKGLLIGGGIVLAVEYVLWLTG